MAVPLGAAIGLMAKAPRPGVAKTRLIPALGAAGAAALAAAFIADTAALLRRSGAAAVAFAAPPGAVATLAALAGLPALPQRGRGLGARLAAAFADLAARSAGPLLVIGADSPTLPLGHIRAALALAAADPQAVVLGPAADGGFWGVALARPLPGLFAGIRWSTATVLAATAARAAALGRPVLRAPPWHDVDRPEDLAQLRADLAADPAAAPRTRAVLRALGAAG